LACANNKWQGRPFSSPKALQTPITLPYFWVFFLKKKPRKEKLGDDIMEKQFDKGKKEGFEDGVRAMLMFFKYQLTGSSSSHIERSLLDRWLEKAKKRFLNEEAKE
jgi:hypothetical protein